MSLPSVRVRAFSHMGCASPRNFPRVARRSLEKYAWSERSIDTLLIGGDKTGNDCFYEEYIPRAERLLREYLAETEANDEEEERGP